MERKKSEQLHFDKEYGRVDQSLIISPDQLSRFMNLVSAHLYGRIFLFYLLGELSEKKVLDYGCGDGDNAVFLAKRGAEVVAIDFSKNAVELTRAKAKANGVEDRVTAIHMDAEHTSFNSEEFDCILGDAILHHLDIRKAKNEIFRILKQDGVSVFREPLVTSKWLRSIRKLIPIYPSNPTKDERPLSYEELKRFGDDFKSTEWREFEIFSRVSYLIKNKKLNKMLHELDCFLMKKIPLTKKLASCVVVRYKK